MKKLLTILVAYSFVIITSVQLLANIICIVNKEFYYEHWFIIANLVGFSIIYLIPMVAVAFLFKFCIPSRICAITQVVLSILWLIIQEDNTYNITAQIVIATLALFLTAKKLIK
jgi:hypothetical protein